MIASLFGRIRSLHPDRTVIEVAGVGYAVVITPATSSRLSVGNDAQLFTSLVVREDSMTLYGFFDEESRVAFDLVLTVSGVGPKVAMSILANLSPDDLASAIAQENVAAIERVPGIGRKGAQRLILELKGKLTYIGSGTSAAHVPLWREQLTSALVSLGYPPREAEASVAALVVAMQDSHEDPAAIALGELLKRALQSGTRGL